MIAHIHGTTLVGHRFPPDEGGRLADHLLHRNLDWTNLQVDLTNLPPALLISGFFNGFLTAIHRKRPDLLDQAKRIDWLLDHDFQRQHVARCMKHFEIH